MTCLLSSFPPAPVGQSLHRPPLVGPPRARLCWDRHLGARCASRQQPPRQGCWLVFQIQMSNGETSAPSSERCQAFHLGADGLPRIRSCSSSTAVAAILFKGARPLRAEGCENPHLSPEEHDCQEHENRTHLGPRLPAGARIGNRWLNPE